MAKPLHSASAVISMNLSSPANVITVTAKFNNENLDEYDEDDPKRERLGKITLRAGGLRWKTRKHKEKVLSWSKFAAIMEKL